jgi:hypothetical protein
MFLYVQVILLILGIADHLGVVVFIRLDLLEFPGAADISILKIIQFLTTAAII